MPIKTSIKRASGWLYLNSPQGRRQLRGAGVILMLHRVLADDQAAELPHRNELCVGPQAFERLLRWLQRQPPPHWVDAEPGSSLGKRWTARVISWLPLESQL